MDYIVNNIVIVLCIAHHYGHSHTIFKTNIEIFHSHTAHNLQGLFSSVIMYSSSYGRSHIVHNYKDYIARLLCIVII